MTPLPKRRHSRRRQGKRRQTISLKKPGFEVCPDCGALKRPHVLCRACGNYKGKNILVKKGKNKKGKKA